MKKYIVIIFLLTSTLIFSQDNKILNKPEWNGYIQLRASSNLKDNSMVMIRRLKFWVKTKPDISHHLSYKIQVLFTSWNQEKLFLQDAKIKYTKGTLSYDFGQFIPAYSLQWTQPDYIIPAIERAEAINILHTDGTLGVRDIGIQINYNSKSNVLESHFGLFNGYGIKEYSFNNKGFMLSHKTAIRIRGNNKRFQLGYSLQYRKAENLKIQKLLPDTVFFTGNDFRYNLFARFESNIFNIQAEYLTAYLEEEKSFGYYVLSTINLRNNEIVLGYEYFKNLTDISNYPYYRLGYNYLIKGNNIKLFFDNYFQFTAGNVNNYTGSIEIQMFFN